MPARTGAQYIAGLREQAAAVYLHGEKVQDVTTHPALRNGVHSLAALYDMQHDAAWREAMTYTDRQPMMQWVREFLERSS
jgi:4-hydroxyphenylacetate 3-monooxygenase